MATVRKERGARDMCGFDNGMIMLVLDCTIIAPLLLPYVVVTGRQVSYTISPGGGGIGSVWTHPDKANGRRLSVS